MRAVWTGSIGFGLVSIPVRLYPATSPKDPRFHLIDRKTGARVRNRRVVREPVAWPEEPASMPDPAPGVEPRSVEEPDPQPHASGAAEEAAEPPSVPRSRAASPAATQREVASEDLVRGYEVEPGRHVLVEAEELEALRPEPSRTIEIEHFVALEEIDPVHFEKSYHLAPGNEMGEKPYHLLRRAMEDEGRVAIGRFVLRTREHLVAIRTTLGVLGLETLYFADEIRQPAGRWTQVTGRTTSRELDMARKLIVAMSETWEPARYEDPYRQAVLDLVSRRTATLEPETGEEEPAAAAVPDLMAALKASVMELTKGSGRRRA